MPRRIGWLLIPLLFLALVSLVWRGAAARQVGGRPAATPAKAAPVAAQAAPGPAAANAFVYTVPTALPVATVVRRLWPTTSYMTRAEFEAALRQANQLRNTTYLKPGQQLQVPGYESVIVEKPIASDPHLEVRAIYLTGLMAGSRLGLDLVRRWREAGGNAVVFDVKDSDGGVNVPFQHPLAPPQSPAIPNLPKYVRWLHQQNLYAIARLAIFRDGTLVRSHPELAVRSRRTGAAWRENGALVWTDPSHRRVQEYNLALAKQVAGAGVDEVQFDYVRFPAEGDQKDTQFEFEKENPAWQRHDVITDFVAHAYDTLHSQGVLVSLDVFGVTAWQDREDLAETGQDVVDLARHCDVLSPMIYPSHFFNMDGYKRPGDAPEHFIGASMERFQKIMAEVRRPGAKAEGVILRPWLQAFRWHTKTYGVDYVLTQVRVAKARGGNGFLFWNAANLYSEPLKAMGIMRQDPAPYFRGDEIPQRPAAVPASPAAGTRH